MTFKIKKIVKKVIKKDTPSSSAFSVFFREASSGEKKKVFSRVAEKASADQRCYMN